ncbi:PAAR domain-containing protein [Zooshikella harenae]|uniref:PAAR domain-containing protein n=1 Tax=Zooshikella harenae TaxID=2827238 RepID=A0ABS5ZI11_9GAMM|nr:PAAR domain-containing protein [Zooshikella harenae]MBU2713707.1 PAAR domain-containing protein [Zooshikella harenae]
MFRLARVGDKDSKGNTIVEGSPNMKDQGLPVARVGDKLSDGSVITTGNPTIMVDGKPAAIVGSQVSNGCAIVGPCSTKVTTGFDTGSGLKSRAKYSQTKSFTNTTSEPKTLNEQDTAEALIHVRVIDFNGCPIPAAYVNGVITNSEGLASIKVKEGSTELEVSKLLSPYHTDPITDTETIYAQKNETYEVELDTETYSAIGKLRVTFCKDVNLDALYGTNICTYDEYQELMNESKQPDHDWDTFDYLGYAFVKVARKVGLGGDPSQSHLAQFKNTWVRENKTGIILSARRYNIKPEIIAGIAWTEVGGDSGLLNIAAHEVRSAVDAFEITKSSDKTSFGDVEIQIRRVPETVGITRKLEYCERVQVINLLKNEQVNIAVVTKYLADMLIQIYPGYTKDSFDDYKIMLSGYLYNMGYPHKLLGADKDLNIITQKNISFYGHDLLKKIDAMRELIK